MCLFGAGCVSGVCVFLWGGWDLSAFGGHGGGVSVFVSIIDQKLIKNTRLPTTKRFSTMSMRPMPCFPASCHVLGHRMEWNETNE